MAVFEKLSNGYRPNLTARQRQRLLRIFATLVLCAASLGRERLTFLAVWGAWYFVFQVVEFAVFRQFMARPGSSLWLVASLVANFALAAVYGSLALSFWLMGNMLAAVAAILIISTGIFTALMFCEGSLTAFLSVVTPLVGYLFALPWIGHPFDGSDLVGLYFVGIGLLCVVLYLVFRWTRGTIEGQRAARAALEDEIAARAAFVAMISHELRTPVSAILNGARAISQDVGEECANARLIADAGVMMRTLLNDLLDFSKIEAGRMSVELIDHDLRLLVLDAVQFWRSAGDAKGVSLVLEGDEHLPQWVRGDPTRVRQVLNNLLSNALKFTTQGQVTVIVRQGEEVGSRSVSIEVRDTGPGIPEEQIGRLFTPYEQFGAETARTFGGTGLGLAISRDLATLMGGELTAANATGGGARFILKIPAPEGRPAAEPDPMETDVLPARAEAPLVLVVDDHDVNRRTLRYLLEAFGAQVEVAEDALAALMIAEGKRFDAILMDVRMPGMDGLEATRRLRTSGENLSTPIIAVTGAVSPDEMAACRAAGMNSCIEKPINASKLYEALFGVDQGS